MDTFNPTGERDLPVKELPEMSTEMVPVPFQVPQIEAVHNQVAAAAEPTIISEPVKDQEPSEFVCRWDGCQFDAGSLRGLVMHVTAHLDDLPWQ
jgi:hypothetical protein